MARRMPKGLELWRSAKGTANFHGIPMPRALAWALHDYELHGGHLLVYSADRRDSVIKAFNKKYGTDLLSQKYLWEHQHDPGFFPANPPGFSSHELRSDGIPFYGKRGEPIPWWKLGIDAVNVPGGDAARVVTWLNAHGYGARRPYTSRKERHHFSFTRSPRAQALKRLRRWKLTGK